MITLMDLVRRKPFPLPWDEGDNIPWHAPDFSDRMLREHLSQEHSAASRRLEEVEEHVNWIDHRLLFRRSSRVLDLGCGPGLYTSRLARRGHECVGIDYSPASIAYARTTAVDEGLPCTYIHDDMREAPYGEGFDLAMLLYGEFNVFRPSDARGVLAKARDAIVPGGTLLLEPHRFSAVRRMGEAPSTWYSAKSGLFSDDAHLCLRENFWHPETKTATFRYYLVDAATTAVKRYAQTFQAYSDDAYAAMLEESGFEDLEFRPAMCESDKKDRYLMVIVARKPAGAS
jgi:SAM-dependent methyltransferase